MITLELLALNLIHWIKRKCCIHVVCDTNVWYRLADGRLKWWNVINKNLILTQVVIEELHSTEVIYKKPDLFLSVVRAIRIHASHVFLLDPLAYVYFRNKGADNVFHEKLMDNYRALINLRRSDKWRWENADSLERLSDKIKLWNQPTTNLCNDVNTNTLPQLKARSKALGKKTIDKENLEVITAKFIYDSIKERFSDGVEIGRNVNLNNLELFLVVFEDFLKYLSKVPTSKIQDNDLNDLMNMLYVTSGMKYWTFDERWSEFISNNAKTTKYLP